MESVDNKPFKVLTGTDYELLNAWINSEADLPAFLADDNDNDENRIPETKADKSIRYIYRIRCTVNGMVYIGATMEEPSARFAQHRYNLNKNIHKNSQLQSDWNKYGKKKFTFKILETCNVENVEARENYWIKHYGGKEGSRNYNKIGSVAKDAMTDFLEQKVGTARSGNWGHSGRPGVRGGSGGGGSAGSIQSPAKKGPSADDIYKIDNVGDRMAAFNALSQAEQDAIADVPNSIDERMLKLVGRGPYPETDVIADAVNQRIDRYNASLEDHDIKSLREFGKNLSDQLDGVDGDPKIKKEIAMRTIDAMVAQNMEAMTRQLGDHGIRHLKGNADISNSILKTIPGSDSPADLLQNTLVAAFHDTGYLTGPSRNFLDGGHPRWSEQYFKAKIAPLTESLMGKQRTGDMIDTIRNHDGTTVDWSTQRSTVQSSFKISDNFALFHKEKFPGLVRYVPGAMDTLIKLGSKQITLEQAKAALHTSLTTAKVKPMTKALLYDAVEEVGALTPKFTVGMLGGSISRFGWNAEGSYLTIGIKRTKANADLNKVLDLGQRQFGKMVEAYGGDIEALKTNQSFDYAVDGKTAFRIEMEGIPIKAWLDYIHTDAMERLHLEQKVGEVSPEFVNFVLEVWTEE